MRNADSLVHIAAGVVSPMMTCCVKDTALRFCLDDNNMRHPRTGGRGKEAF